MGTTRPRASPRRYRCRSSRGRRCRCRPPRRSARGTSLRACTAAFTKKLMKPIFTPCSLVNASWNFFAHVHHGGHVHSAERGQDGVGRLRLQQTLGHTGAQAGHGHTLLWTVAQVGAAGAATWGSALVGTPVGITLGATAGLAPPGHGGTTRHPWSRGHPCRSQPRRQQTGCCRPAAWRRQVRPRRPWSRQQQVPPRLPLRQQGPQLWLRGSSSSAAAPALPSVSILAMTWSDTTVPPSPTTSSASTPAEGAGTSEHDLVGFGI